MQVQVNTDKAITHDASLDDHVESVVRSAVERFGETITRVEVHLGDNNSSKKGGSNDKRCMMEARVGGLPPIAVTELSSDLRLAISGASSKLVRALDTAIGKRSDVKHNVPVADLVQPDPVDD